MEAFSPYLVNALKDPEYPSISTAIGLIADLSHALGPAIGKYAPNFMALFRQLVAEPTNVSQREDNDFILLWRHCVLFGQWLPDLLGSGYEGCS